MHELSLCHAISEAVAPHCHSQRLTAVNVRVGALRQVVPETLIYCWGIVGEHAGFPDAKLHVEVVPAEVSCRDCGVTSVIASRWSVRCPACDSGAVEVVAGEEFLVTSIEVMPAAPEAGAEEKVS